MKPDRANRREIEAARAAAFAEQFRKIDDGYPESSPVEAFPLGASPFGIEDITGNVREWYLDLSRTVPWCTESESASARGRRQTRSPRRNLEIPF